MSVLAVGYIGLALLILFLFSGIHIGVIMALIGFFGMAYLRGWDAGLALTEAIPFTTFYSYDISVIPLFILMGTFCYRAGISEDLYNALNVWLGQLRGGLSMATVSACAGFAAVSGSSLATAATMGMVSLPEMKRFKYDEGLATGSIAAGGTIGILIPPSICMVIYCIITQQSIGKLFLAGFIPGVLQAVFYIVAIYIVCRINPMWGPSGPRSSMRSKIMALSKVWPVLLLFLLVIGGIYTGIFSPSEAAGVGAFGAFVIALARKRLNWQKFKSAVLDTISSTAMLFLILMGAMMLTYFLSVTRLPFELANTISAMTVGPYAVLTLILILYLILGCVMDSMAMILLTVPVLYPLVLSMGFDPIWFGIIMVRVVEIGLITPPVGLNVYVLKGIAKDVPMQSIFRGLIPFIVADVCHVVLLVIFPELSLFLPSFMK
jgi:C4-dicarboxylate transporter DctM subunit